MVAAMEVVMCVRRSLEWCDLSVK